MRMLAMSERQDRLGVTDSGWTAAVDTAQVDTCQWDTTGNLMANASSIMAQTSSSVETYHALVSAV